jgi:hypothetical protein
MTRVLIASRAANTLGHSGGNPERPRARAPEPERPGLVRRALAAMGELRRGRAPERAGAKPAPSRTPEIAVDARAQR